jgi:hypothetical protein
MNTQIDWEKLASELGLLKANGESAGSDEALRALEQIIGEDALRRSVDHVVARRPGSELARSVLWQLRPWSAMSYCYEIFKEPGDLENRRAAVNLLRVVADHRALPWIKGFLDDRDTGIQRCGVGVLDQLLWSELVEPEDTEELIKPAETHSDEYVRERAEFIRRYLQDRS